HRIRIWILTPAELTLLNSPANRLLAFREAISAGHGVELQDGAVLLDGTAVPNGTQVFGVRPPDIDDGGVMDHGNHQIHPAIKPCLSLTTIAFAAKRCCIHKYTTFANG